MKTMKYITILLLVAVSFTLGSCKSESVVKDVKPKLMWFDATANYERLSNPDSIDYYLNKIKQLGFTDAVVDIRPISGYVLYQSQYAPYLGEHKGYQRDPNFDFLQYFIDASHKLGLQVHASMNTFVAGHNFVDKGIIYEEDKDEWATIVYSPEKGLIPITEEKHKYSAMVNPINKDFQTYILNIFKEVVNKYPKLDGVMLDRVRYDGISADFSELSKTEFEKYLGESIKNFPEDIFVWGQNENNQYYPIRGKYFLKWIEWRSNNITNFMKLAKAELKAVNPNISFGTYTGAWYPSYYEVGVNFSSKDYDPSIDFDWATGSYKDTGYAEVMDLYTVGNYYTDITKEDYVKNGKAVKNETDILATKNIWYCVEGSNENLKRIMGENKFIGGILADQFYENFDGLTESIKMNLKTSDGLMIFDIVHIIEKDMWDAVEKGMRESGVIQ